MKNKKILLLLLITLISLTGCTKNLKDKDNKIVVNEITGQNLTENILCRPTDEETIKIYKEHEVDIDSLPYCSCKTDKVKKEVTTIDENGEEIITTEEVDCESFKISSGENEGIWAGFFVKPLAFVILFFGRITKNYGIGLIITSLIIRLIAYPVTRKTAIQSEYMKKAGPEIQKIEKKYADKDQNDREIMMQKSQEMMMVYKKYNVSPMGGCLLSFLQLPLFIAFLEAINRVPAIFEEKFLLFHLGTTPMTGIKNGNYWYIIIILVVAASTYFSFKATMKDQASTADQMKNQQKMMTNMFTIMIIVMSVFMTTALDIYWMTTNLFTIIQNIIVRRKVK